MNPKRLMVGAFAVLAFALAGLCALWLWTGTQGWRFLTGYALILATAIVATQFVCAWSRRADR